MMTKNETLEVVKRAIAGDQEALTSLCEEKGKKILYIAFGMMGNLHDAEEVMQEVLIILFQNIGKLRRPEFFDLWLYRVTHRECNLQRKRRAPKDKTMHFTEEQLNLVPEGRVEFIPSEFVEDGEKRGLLLQVVEGLRPPYRMAVLLYYYGGLSHEQIAQVMGVNAAMVNNYLTRARKKIREELQKSEHTKFKNVFSAVSAPVLTHAFEKHADRLITQQRINEFVGKAKSIRTSCAPSKAVGWSVVTKVMAGVAAAFVMVGAAVSVGAAPQEQSPLSSPATAVQGYPQRPQATPVAEEGLEIDETLSPMAGQVPQSVPAEDGEAEIVIAPARQVRGVIVLKDVNGNVAEGIGKYIADVPLDLADRSGNVVATTNTDGGGAFDFGTVTAADGYTVKLGAGDTQLLPAKENPQGMVLPGMAEGEKLTLYVVKDFDPKVEIRLLGGECGCGHVNPKSAKAFSADELDTLQRWEIADEEGQAVAQGETKEIDTALQTLPEGTYTICWKINDVLGNLATAKRAFRIVNGPVDPDMYE